jgi:hypothetical protein
VGLARRGLLRLRELPAPGDVICAESGCPGDWVQCVVSVCVCAVGYVWGSVTE